MNAAIVLRNSKNENYILQIFWFSSHSITAPRTVAADEALDALDIRI